MAFGLGAFGLMQGGGQFSGPVGLAQARDPRYAMALALSKQAGDTSPIQSPWQGVNRVAQGALSGYMLGSTQQEYQDRQNAYQKAVADSLKLGMGTPEVSRTQTEDQSMYGGPASGEKVVTAPAVPGDVRAMVAALSGNQDAAPMAAQFQLSSIAARQAAEAQAAAQANAPYTLTPGATRFGPNGQSIANVPAIPERPQTVNTAEGVFILNRDGTKGERIGGPSALVTMNLPPSGYTPVDPNKPAAGMAPIPGGPADPATIAARAAAEQSAKPDPALAKAKTDFSTARDEAAVIVNALQDFKEASASAGLGQTAASAAGRSTPLNTAYNKAALMAKGEQLFNLGVLNGPDLDIIRRTLPDPSTLTGATASQKDVNAAVQQVIDLIQDRVNTKAMTAKEAPTNLIEYGRTIRGNANAPKVGDVVDGYTFKGGDPANPNSWQKN